MAVGGLFVLAAGILTGRVDVFGYRRRWFTAPAVVLAVEPVNYRDPSGGRSRGRGGRDSNETGAPAVKST